MLSEQNMPNIIQTTVTIVAAYERLMCQDSEIYAVGTSWREIADVSVASTRRA